MRRIPIALGFLDDTQERTLKGTGSMPPLLHVLGITLLCVAGACATSKSTKKPLPGPPTTWKASGDDAAGLRQIGEIAEREKAPHSAAKYYAAASCLEPGDGTLLLRAAWLTESWDKDLAASQARAACDINPALAPEISMWLGRSCDAP